MKKTLYEVAEISAGQGAPQGDNEYSLQGTPFVKAGNLNDLMNGESINSIQKVSEYTAQKYKLRKFPKGTVVFAKSGMSCLKGCVYVLPMDAYVVNHLACIIPKYDLSEYLKFYFLYHKPNELIKDMSYPSIRLQDISNIEINLPEEIERSIIVKKLNNLKLQISLKETQLKMYDQLIKSRFVEMFFEEDSKDKHTLRKWKEVVTIKHGKDYKNNLVERDGYPIYGSGGFMGVYADKYLVEEYSTIIGRKGTIDKPLFVKEKFWNVDTAFGIEVNKDILDPIFFYYRSTFYELKKMSTSTTLPSMTQSALNNIEIGVPPMDIQKQFSLFVQQVDKLKFADYFLCFK